MDLSITPAVYVKLGAVTAISMSNMDRPHNSPTTDSGNRSHKRPERQSLPQMLTNQKPRRPAEPTRIISSQEILSTRF